MNSLIGGCFWEEFLGFYGNSLSIFLLELFFYLDLKKINKVGFFFSECVFVRLFIEVSGNCVVLSFDV